MANLKIRTALAVLILLLFGFAGNDPLLRCTRKDIGLPSAGLWSICARAGEPADRAAVPADDFKAGEILVKFKGDISALAAQRTLQQQDATYIRTLYGSEVELWQVPVGSELATAEELNANPLVEYAEPNYRVHAADRVPNDPSFSKQWAHTVMQSPAAWEITTGGTAIKIAIIDTGIDPTHPELATKTEPGYDFVDNDTAPFDLNGHGTHVAGIASAITNNGLGVAGMDWNARLVPIRVLDEQGIGYVAAVADGIVWAYTHGARVLNLSLEGPSSQSLRDAVNAAYAAGSLVVAAMGNAGSSTPVYPAAYSKVLAVAATGPTDVRAPYSNVGAHCDVAAPGGVMNIDHDPNGIYSTMPTYPVYMTTQDGYDTSYDYVQGTSQAAPYVSGLAALMWGTNSSLTNDQLQSYMKNTAVDLGTPGWDSAYGYGRISALAALRAVTPVLFAIENADKDGVYLVDWNNVPNATSYTLYEDEDPSFSTPATRYRGSTSQYQVNGQGGGIWHYRVRASLSNGTFVWSNTQSVGVIPGVPTLAPIDNPSHGGDYRLAWSQVPGATAYRLEEDDTPAFSSPAVLYVGSGLLYDVTGQVGGTWYYRVRASNTVGSGPWSDVQWITVRPGAPTLLGISNPGTLDEYQLAWMAVAGASSYVLEESHDSSFITPTVRYVGKALQYNVTGQPNGTWYYRVRAYNSGGDGPWSNTQPTTVTVATLLAPDLFAIDNADGDGEFLVGWSEVSGASSYVLEQSRDPYFSTPTQAYAVPELQVSVTEQPGGTWYYRVRAFGAGGRGPWSNQRSVIVTVWVYLPMVANNGAAIGTGDPEAGR